MLRIRWLDGADFLKDGFVWKLNYCAIEVSLAKSL